MKKIKNVIIISITFFMLMVIGVSYAFFTYDKEIANVSLNTGEISMNLSNVNGDVLLTNTTIKTDDDGISSEEYLDFTVTGITDTESIYYEVYIIPKSGSNLNTDYLKLYLSDQNDIHISGSQLYPYLKNSKTNDGKVVYSETLIANTDGSKNTTTRNFRLRMWLDDNYPDVSSKTFNFDIYLYAENTKVNMMNIFPSKITNLKTNISEIHFENDTKENIERDYALIDNSLKEDITYNNIGNVKAWLVSDISNDGMYKLYVKSDGQTYLNTGENLFKDFENMTSIDLSNVNTSKVTKMSYMFYRCLSLITLDVSNFDTTNVTSMSYMFSGQSTVSIDDYMNLEEINGLTSFNTSKVTSMSSMFHMAIKLTTLDLRSFNTSQVTTMKNMFGGTWSGTLRKMKLTNIYGIENFDVRKVTSFMGMFYACSKLVYLDLSKWDTRSATSMYAMFIRNESLVDIKINFNTSKVTTMYRMFRECFNLTTLDLSSFDTSKVKNTEQMFYNNTNLVTIYVSDKWTNSPMTTSTSMFSSSNNIVGGNGTPYNSSNVDATYARIDGKDGLPGYLTDIKDK